MLGPVYSDREMRTARTATQRLASQMDTPPAKLGQLATHRDSEVRGRVAGRPTCPPEALRRLAGDEDAYVRSAVGGNPEIANDLLLVLARDAEPWVRVMVGTNPKCPAPLLLRLAEDPAPVDRQLVPAVANRPALLLDIDGVVSPVVMTMTERGEQYTPELHPNTWSDWRNIQIDEMPISDKMLGAIFALPLEVIWCTTWLENVNLVLGEQLGLPPLPYIELHKSRSWRKRGAVRRWVTDNPLRPVIWVDDDPRTRRCRKWLRDLQPRSLIVNPDKTVGLTPTNIDSISRFLSGLV